MLSTSVIAYLFLGGAGSGACLWVSALNSRLESNRSWQQLPQARGMVQRRLIAPVLAVSLALLAMGFICLLADLGSPEKLLSLVFSQHVSWGTVGAYALAATMLVCLLQALASASGALRAHPLASRLLRLASLALAFVTMLYTGMLLYDMGGVPLWHSPALPLLFVLSSLSSGAAVFIACSQLFESSAPVRRELDILTGIDCALTAAELAALYALLAPACGSTASETLHLSALSLLWGEYAQLFLGGAVGAGMLAPLAINLLIVQRARHGLMNPKPQLALVLLSALCALGGAAALRFCLVAAGTHPFLGVGALYLLGT